MKDPHWNESVIEKFLSDDRDVMLLLLAEVKAELRATDRILTDLAFLAEQAKPVVGGRGVEMDAYRPASYYQVLLQQNEEWRNFAQSSFWQYEEQVFGGASEEFCQAKQDWFSLLKRVAILDIVAIINRLSGESLKPIGPSGELAIPPRHRTRPLSLAKAGGLLGRAKGKVAGEWMRRSIDEGNIQAIKFSRQQFVFDIRIFPESAQKFLAPSRTDAK